MEVYPHLNPQALLFFHLLCLGHKKAPPARGLTLWGEPAVAFCLLSYAQHGCVQDRGSFRYVSESRYCICFGRFVKSSAIPHSDFRTPHSAKWAIQDLNLRPLPYQRSALTN